MPGRCARPGSSLLFFPLRFFFSLSDARAAGRAGDLGLLAQLAQAGQLGGAGGERALVGAVCGGHLPAVQYLLGRGVAVDARDDGEQRSALAWAAASDHVGVARYLIKEGADLHLADARGRTPLAWAAAAGHTGAVNLLLSHGAAEGAAADAEGRTPLHLAAENGHAAYIYQNPM